MKRSHIVVACVAPLVLWLLVPFLIHYPSFVYKKLDECKQPSTDLCKDRIAALGQAGDTYGIVSSLFSGLALFAVAGTLYADFAARRSSRKPLVVCTIDAVKEVTFDEPHHTNPRSIRFNTSLQVKAANDSALNTEVTVELAVGLYKLDLGRQYVQVPLLSGDFVTLEFSRRIEDIASLVTGMKAGHAMSIKISAKCESIEGLFWATAVAYRLKFRNSGDSLKMQKLVDDEDTLIEAWKGNAAVALNGELEPNSWSYKSI